MRMFSIMGLLIALCMVQPAYAQQTMPTMSVTGTGTSSAPPDIATVLTGVEVFAPSASEALVENSERMAEILRVLADAGIEAKDVQTSSLSVSPRYKDRKSGNQFEIAGYQVRNGLSVRVRNITSLGEVLDAIVSTGANRIDGVSFGFADPVELWREARTNAIMDARTSAETYAAAAGVQLGQILSISDGSAPPSPMRGMAMVEMSRAAVPIAVGQSSISDTVRIVWELKQ